MFRSYIKKTADALLMNSKNSAIIRVNYVSLRQMHFILFTEIIKKV